MTSKRMLLGILMISLIILPACRRDPRQPTRYYEREMAQMAEPKPTETYLPDRYPWEAKRNSLDGVPERIIQFERKVDRQICLWDKLFKRDCCPPPLPDRCRYHCHHPCNCPR